MPSAPSAGPMSRRSTASKSTPLCSLKGRTMKARIYYLPLEVCDRNAPWPRRPRTQPSRVPDVSDRAHLLKLARTKADIGLAPQLKISYFILPFLANWKGGRDSSACQGVSESM